jgi:hypothetical protein
VHGVDDRRGEQPFLGACFPRGPAGKLIQNEQGCGKQVDSGKALPSAGPICDLVVGNAYEMFQKKEDGAIKVVLKP